MKEIGIHALWSLGFMGKSMIPRRKENFKEKFNILLTMSMTSLTSSRPVEVFLTGLVKCYQGKRKHLFWGWIPTPTPPFNSTTLMYGYGAEATLEKIN